MKTIRQINQNKQDKLQSTLNELELSKFRYDSQMLENRGPVKEPPAKAPAKPRRKKIPPFVEGKKDMPDNILEGYYGKSFYDEA